MHGPRYAQGCAVWSRHCFGSGKTGRVEPVPSPLNTVLSYACGWLLNGDFTTNLLLFSDERVFKIRKVKTKFHHAILVADRSEAGRGPTASWNLAYHLAR